MTKKCIYCKTQIDDASVMDVCRRCGIGVWGERMFEAIKSSMEGARDSGNLFQGSISNPQVPKQSREHSFQRKSPEPPMQHSTALASMSIEAMRSKETEQKNL